ncbi:hypothetical protein [Methylobacterium radiotolerans]|uniref:Uncharacterized protein n=1 Tax=Methylobacterium radiotolerans (strain ATCC 27329 / DSM 1819 / JCM 2831 / NBRC 15690 / NCIMB 10815 / 0-1) TaxID=426355 RepID=B1LXD8_METRJ|nr:MULTISPECIES: hypothetical protein [Methylobacterium]ACB27259.1 hypothetical protein Mrad2831_5312 [Methylobacterium radiotolerans JCM 2831]GEM98244.1 hypothetical protein MRA01_27840 [Methylobacterium radiotolerans]
MPVTAADRSRLQAAIARARADRPDPDFLDRAGHQRVAYDAVVANPALVIRARRVGDCLPLVRAAERAAGKDNVSTFMLAVLIGKLVRGEA